MDRLASFLDGAAGAAVIECLLAVSLIVILIIAALTIFNTFAGSRRPSHTGKACGLPPRTRRQARLDARS